MSSHRLQTLFILAFWAASMTWLGWSKIRSAARPDQAPRQGDLLPLDATELPPVRWQIHLNREKLGWARQDIERDADGQGRISSEIHLERLSIDHVLRRGLGTGLGNLATSLATRGLGAFPAEITLAIKTTMHFDHFGQLHRFESNVKEQEWGECIRIQGTVYDGELVVKAYVMLGDLPINGDAVENSQLSSTTTKPLKELRLPLPEDKLLVDSLAPRPRFKNLSSGQSWTFETYHPLFPTSPMQTVVARVVGKEVIQQNEESIRTFHVVYERGTDDGLSLERHLADVWVRADGEVVRQTMTWGQVTLTFDRVNEDSDFDASQDSTFDEPLKEVRNDSPVTTAMPATDTIPIGN